jgi:hypothetical protein
VLYAGTVVKRICAPAKSKDAYWWRIEYVDGDSEEVELVELLAILVPRDGWVLYGCADGSAYEWLTTKTATATAAADASLAVLHVISTSTALGADGVLLTELGGVDYRQQPLVAAFDAEVTANAGTVTRVVCSSGSGHPVTVTYGRHPHHAAALQQVQARIHDRDYDADYDAFARDIDALYKRDGNVFVVVSPSDSTWRRSTGDRGIVRYAKDMHDELIKPGFTTAVAWLPETTGKAGSSHMAVYTYDRSDDGSIVVRGFDSQAKRTAATPKVVHDTIRNSTKEKKKVKQGKNICHHPANRCTLCVRNGVQYAWADVGTSVSNSDCLPNAVVLVGVAGYGFTETNALGHALVGECLFWHEHGHKLRSHFETQFGTGLDVPARPVANTAGVVVDGGGGGGGGGGGAATGSCARLGHPSDVRLDAVHVALCGHRDAQSAAELAKTLESGLLWLKPEAFDGAEHLADAGAANPEETEAEAQLAFPSLHTCFVCNVIAVVDFLRCKGQSRFVQRRGIPPVYLSVQINYDTFENGELNTCEIAPHDHQDECRKEMAEFAQVAFSVDPACKSDWLQYFNREFVLKEMIEVWAATAPSVAGSEATYLWTQTTRQEHLALLSTAGKGAGAASNETVPAAIADAVKRTKTDKQRKKMFEIYSVFSLQKTSLAQLDAALRQQQYCTIKQRRSKGPTIEGGCVLVFREPKSKDEQPFGVWVAFFVAAESRDVVFLDLQNSAVWTRSLESYVIETLEWDVKPSKDVFYAPFKNYD